MFTSLSWVRGWSPVAVFGWGRRQVVQKAMSRDEVLSRLAKLLNTARYLASSSSPHGDVSPHTYELDALALQCAIEAVKRDGNVVPNRKGGSGDEPNARRNPPATAGGGVSG